MDQTIVDISRAGNVSIGDEAVVIGRQGEGEITADDLAGWAGTINYEVACNLGNRLPRVFFK
jgi:alanine racemase